MPDDEPHAQLVEYLAAAEGLIGDESVIVITIRPDPPAFFPHNIAITKAQAWRLAADIQGLLLPFALLVCLLTTTGCGARVAMESAKWHSSGGERAATTVEVDVLQAQRREQQAPFDAPKDGERPLKIAPEPIQPVAKPQATAPPAPKTTAPTDKPINVAGNTLVLNYRAGDVTYHNETHVHVVVPPVPRVEERVVVRREIRAEPPRHVDERCEQLAREHEERVEMWRKFPFGN